MYFFEPEKVPLSASKGWIAYDLIMKSGHTSQDYIDISKISGYHKFDNPAIPDYAITGGQLDRQAPAERFRDLHLR